MSRFYDALKEANRSHPPVGQSPAAVHKGDLSQLEGDNPLAAEIPAQRLESLHQDLPNLTAIGPRPIVNQPTTTAPAGVLSDLAVDEPEQSNQPSEQANSSPGPELLEHSSKPPGATPANGAGSPAPLRAKIEISFDPSARLIPHAADSVVVEHYRRLRTKILQQHANKPFRSLMVASPGPQEGKTVTVLNLGLSFALLPNFKVLVIDGDLRRGTIGKLLGIDDSPGLSNILEGAAQLEEVILKCADIPVQFVMRGNSKVPPAELLHSPQLDTQFRRMTEQFDLVLVDSPPVNLITDAQLLAGSCDAVLLIARAFSTTRKSLEQAVKDLSGFRMLGTVLNGGTRAQLYNRRNSYYTQGQAARR